MARFAVVVICSISTAYLALAQDIIGTWQVSPSFDLLPRFQQLILQLSRDPHGALAGTLYRGGGPNATVSCSSVSLKGSELSFLAPGNLAGGSFMSFSGKLSADGQSISGWMRGDGVSSWLNLTRADGPRDAEGVPDYLKHADRPRDAAVVPAPGIAEPVVAGVRPNGESADVLARALAKLSGTDRRLAKYTCTETIDRSSYSLPLAKARGVMTQAPQASCEGRGFSPAGRLTLDSRDRLRIDVAFADGKEIASWAAETRFDSRPIYDMVDGQTSTGAFGAILVDVFENPGAEFLYAGKPREGVLEYAFNVPLAASHYFVGSGAVRHNTAYHGTFEIDATTAGLTRLNSETAELKQPVSGTVELSQGASACRFRTSAEYQYLTIGDGSYLVPLKSSNDGVLPDGEEGHSTTTFSNCREYGAESSLILGEVPVTTARPAAPGLLPPLPAHISMTLALADSIDTDSSAAGDEVSARVVNDVRAPGSQEVLVPAGAIAHGRILDLREDVHSSQFLISIHLETLEQNGKVRPFHAQLDSHLEAARLKRRNSLSARAPEFTLSHALHGEAGGLFVLAAVKGRATLPKGFESAWVTLAR